MALFTVIVLAIAAGAVGVVTLVLAWQLVRAAARPHQK